MYECYARKKPWSGYTNAAAVHKVLSAQRMAPPKAAPPVIRDLMRKTWHSKPNKRPSMAQICTALSAAVLVNEDDQVPGEQTVDYGDLISVYPTIRDFEDNAANAGSALPEETQADLDTGDSGED